MPLNPSHRTLRALIAAMAVIAIAVGASSILLLYRSAYTATLSEMEHGAQRAAGMIEAIAQYHQRHGANSHPQGVVGATLSQVEAGILQQASMHPGWEIIFGRRSGDQLQVLRVLPGKGLQPAAQLPFDGVLARPLYLALNGESGSGELPDYAGTPVLAGYAPLPSLNYGIVFKVDKSALQAPFIHASLWAAAIAAALIALGAILFARVTRPLQRRAEESEQRFSALVNSAPAGVFEADLEGRCTYVNDRMCQFAGRPADQLLGENWVQALHPDDRAGVQDAWKKFVRQGLPFDLEFRFLRPDGGVRWLYTQARGLAGADDKPRGYTGILTDITDSVEARAAARLSDEHLNEAQRLAQVGSWELDLINNTLHWSDEIFRIFEIDKSRFAASYEAFLNAIHPEDRAMVNQAYTDSLTQRTPYAIEHRLLMQDGRVKWVQERCETFYDADDKPLRSAGTVQDISQRVAIERELNTFKTTLDQTLDCVFMFDASTLRFLYANQGAMNQVGYSRDELLRMTPVDIKPHLDEARFRAMLDPLLQGELHELRFTTTHRHKHGREIPVSIFLQHIQPPNDSARFVAVVRDITEQLHVQQEMHELNLTLESRVAERTRELECAKEAAESANRAKSEFLSRMSHELRTPMNAILGFSQVLEAEDINPEQRDFAHEIHRAGAHLLQLIDELLDLSRIESGKMVMALQPVRLSALISDALQLTQGLIQSRRIAVVNRCDVQASVLADPTRLKQILVNLLSNAAKYNRDGGRILLECQQREGDQLRLAITDSGSGIPQEKQSCLFTPFERLGAEHTAVDGSGIGLALSKQLAVLMGGALGCDSHPGTGSTFWLDLPLAPAQSNSAACAPATLTGASSDARCKVLYVEDNAANLKVIEALFRRQQYLTLLTATNGEYGLELARRYQPDAILLDIHLPRMDGYAVLAALQADAATADIPVLALSADAMPIDVERGLQAGFTQYLTKPIQIHEVMRALQAVLGERMAS